MEALQAGLIVPLSDAYKVPKLLEKFDELIIDYKFLHDRVQQAAYSLIPENRKQEVHLKVGQLLLKNTSPAEREEKIFDIVNQFNIGAELITDPSERYELAQLNLMAGRKAKAATAYESALKYLTLGIELLADNSWQSHYHLTLALYVEAVEVQYLTTNFEKAQRLSEIVLAQANSLLDKVKLYELKIQFYIAQNQMIEAIDTALPVVELLGYPLSQNPRELSLVAELPQLSDLESFPEMTNPAQLAVLQILTIITGPAYQAKPDLLPFIVFKMVNVCLEFGHSALAAYAYGMYGLMLCGSLGDIESGYHSGQLSLRLLEQYPDHTLNCKIHMLFNSFVGHWKEHHRETIPAFVDNIQMGFETGDVVYAAYCCMWSCGYLLFTGDPLDVVEEKQRQYVELLEKIKQEHGLYPAKTWRQLTLNLQGLATDKYQLVGESFNQADMQHIEEINNRMLLFFAYFARLILAYIFKDYETAVANTKLAAEYQAAATASMLSGGYVFYDSLARLALYPTVNRDEQQAFLQQIESNQAKMQDWAHHAPMNYQSKYELVEAEKARVLGRVVEAMERYDRAIALAREHGYIQEIAIASERAAEFYQALGRERFAQLYLVDAHYAYCRWGAMAKAQELQQAYPQLLSQRTVTVEPQLTTVPTTPTTGDYGGVLDLTTVMKASQAISSEIVLDKLLSALMKIIIQNAGAQTGYLILQSHAEPGNEERQWRIEAEGSVESDGVTVLQSIPIDNRLPASIINYVARTKETVVLNDATRQGKFTLDPYIKTHQTKSILCAPLINQGHLTGIVYLENNLTPGAFTRDRLEVLQLLSGQAAIAITNAQLYEALFKAEHKYRSIFENALEGIFQ
ncbi:MAG TPA: serine/threonine protein kinase, partial [Cyanobacteria bacterium UBA11049]|nr:serine/threonine protein kinase [Cyanobacteria bacterium UBA11049]